MSWARFDRPIRSALVPGILCLALAGCDREGSAEPDVRGRLQWLVGGTPDVADPAVVTTEMDIDGEGGSCTASFIDRAVLLTAAHCVADQNAQVPARARYRVYLGADLSAAREQDWIPVQTKNVHAHPHYDPNSSANDVAILVLDQPVDVTPLALNSKALAPEMVGAQVRLVGYGSTSGVSGPRDGFGQKRTLTTTIQMVQSDVLLIGTTGHQACDGDSGGPALLEIQGVETIVGTDDYNSFGFNCTQGDYYQRVDRQLDFITPFLATHPGSPAALPPDAGVPNPAQAPGAAVTSVAGAGALPTPGAVTADAGALQPNGGAVPTPGAGSAGLQPIAMGTAGTAAAPPAMRPSESRPASGCSIAPAHSRSHAVAVLSGALLLAFTLRRRRQRNMPTSARSAAETSAASPHHRRARTPARR